MSAPTPYLASIAVDAVIDALGAYIQPFVSPAQIVRGQVNRVPPPESAFVELTEINQSDIEVPRLGYDATNAQMDMISPKRIDVQADFYGPLAGDWCSAVKGTWRTPYAVAQFPAGIAPLYCDDGRQAPLITGEDQYLRRWILMCSLQFNPIVAVPELAASILKMNLVEDVTTL